jgi:hypothetical protein
MISKISINSSSKSSTSSATHIKDLIAKLEITLLFHMLSELIK